MKCVMVFLVLSLVVLMADPGECFLRHIWRGAKAAFRAARGGWRSYHRQRNMNQIGRYMRIMSQQRARQRQQQIQQQQLARCRAMLG
ncbi:pleurocidin-like peptide WF3 [Scomber japonicus]|uniref:pleurocidin-like peptide WF3 n=1 Tax=Scomber japonicus TaxID=13676 RepID=UPI00230640A2|nr:pleurocidin-like peptide WF3 [Scomber japonicus]